MIDERIESGMEEEEAVALLGSPEEIAQNILREVPVADGEKTAKVTTSITVPQEFAKINVTDINRDINFLASPDAVCRVDYSNIPGMETKVYVKDNCLHFESEDKRRWFDKLRGTFRTGGRVDLYLPAEKYKEIKVHDVSGDISISQTYADEIHISTTNGDVEFNKIEAGVLHVSTTNGDVKINGDSAEIHIATVNGDIRGSLKTGKDFHVSTVMGDVRVPVSDPNGGKCHLSTVNGDVVVKIG